MSSLFAENPVYSDCLVVGSGIAGLQFSLLASRRGTVQIVTKKESHESNTNYAQGGIAAAVSPLDDFDTHVADTLDAGDGLCNEAIVREMVAAGPGCIERLLDLGVQFSRDEEGGGFALGREGGHSRRRVLHCQDLTGREIETRLLEACRADKAIDLHENHIGLDLILARDLGETGAEADRVVGCWVLDRNTLGQQAYLADRVVLATGGCGKVYSYTSNPDIATGDGLAMAYRAGAKLMNLEFVQFHPTCLYHPEAKSFLISEAVRGEGAVLINGRGERFMQRYHPLADLAPRDTVARSIDQEMKTSGDASVYLDLRHLRRDKVEARFPNLVKTCANFGIDMAGDPVPVVPAAHYMCGGLKVDGHGRSSMSGLYAIGEVACTGIHGANRLASNSLLEAVFFAERAAEACGEDPKFFTAARPRPELRPRSLDHYASGPGAVMLEHDWDVVRRVMWDYVGIVREKERMDIALKRLRQIRQTTETLYEESLVGPDIAELRNIALLAELIVLCAISRRESRGLHYTLDYPQKAERPEDTYIRRREEIAGHRSWEPEEPPRG